MTGSQAWTDSDGDRIEVVTDRAGSAYIRITTKSAGEHAEVILSHDQTGELIDLLQGAGGDRSTGEAPGVIARPADVEVTVEVDATAALAGLATAQRYLEQLTAGPGTYGWVADDGEHTEWVVYETSTGGIRRFEGGGRAIAVREANLAGPNYVAMPADAAMLRREDWRAGRASGS